MATGRQTALPSAPLAGAGGVIDDFGFALGVLVRAYQAMVATVLDGFPQGARGYQTLARAARGDQPSQLALATCLGIDRTVMTYLVDDLVAAGLAERQLNPADRRQRKIVPTARGICTLEDLQRQVRDAEDRLLGALDEAGRGTFRDLLCQAAGAVQDVASGLAPCAAGPGPARGPDPARDPLGG